MSDVDPRELPFLRMLLKSLMDREVTLVVEDATGDHQELLLLDGRLLALALSPQDLADTLVDAEVKDEHIELLLTAIWGEVD